MTSTNRELSELSAEERLAHREGRKRAQGLAETLLGNRELASVDVCPARPPPGI